MKILLLVFTLSAMTFAKTSIGVLPFDNNTNDSSLAWVGTGIAETVTDKLRSVEKFELVERTAMQKLYHEVALGQTGVVDDQTAQKTGRMSGAQVLVFGAYQKAGKRVRISVKMVETETGKIKKTGVVTGKMKQLFDLQDQIALKVIDQTKVKVSPAELTKVKQRNTNSLAAYEWYVRSLDKDKETKRKCLEKALEYDANYSYALKEMLALERRLKDYRKERDAWENKQKSLLIRQLEQGGPAAVQSAMQLMGNLLAAQKYDELLKLTDEILQAARNNDQLLRVVDLAYYYRLTCYQVQKKYDLLLKEGERFLKNFPTSQWFPAAENLVKMAVQMKGYAAASKLDELFSKNDYDGVIREAPKFIASAKGIGGSSVNVEKAWYYLILSHQSKGDKQKAQTEARKYLKAFPGGTFAKAVKSQVRMEKK